MNWSLDLSSKTKLLLTLFLATFLTMIAGVVWFDWWLTEMSTLFLASAILIALIERINEKKFLDQFIKGAESLLGVAFIVGVARGVTIVLNNGHISDSILFYSARLGEWNAAVIIYSCAVNSIYGLYIIYRIFFRNGRINYANYRRTCSNSTCSGKRNRKYIFIWNGHNGFPYTNRINIALTCSCQCKFQGMVEIYLSLIDYPLYFMCTFPGDWNLFIGFKYSLIVFN